MKLDELIGWYGAIVLLLSFALNTTNIITTNSLIYLLLNFTGALGIMWIALKKKTYQPAVLNGVWSIIALVGIVRLFVG